jgi:hypothetical protein
MNLLTICHLLLKSFFYSKENNTLASEFEKIPTPNLQTTKYSQNVL